MTDQPPPPPRQSPTVTSAADLLGPLEVLSIQDQGHAAGFAGDTPMACPWASATDPTDVARRTMWIRGYAAGRTDLRDAKATSPPSSQSPDVLF